MNSNITAYCIVLSSCPSKAIAEALAHKVMDAKCAACIHIVPQITAIYRWKNQVEQAEEVQIILKTRKDKLDGLEKLVKEHHPYEIPEWLVLPVEGGSQAYLAWLDSEL